MRLNGWQRLWVVVSLAWTLIVAVAAWNTWPRAELSLASSFPVGADVTLLMTGVVDQEGKMTKAEFASRLKKAFPVYGDLSDEDLVDRTLKKYPQYRQFVSDLDWFERNAPTMPEEKATSILARGLLLWLAPPLALYAVGFAAAWVYRGFRPS